MPGSVRKNQGGDMERLWAPWRVEYVASEEPPPPGCVFCNAAGGDERGGNLVLRRGELTLTMMNRYPYNNGHMLVVPNRHVAGLDGLTADERADIMDSTSIAVRMLRQALNCDGCNVGMNLGSAAGAGIEAHLHQHVVPRWSGDTNFMTVVDDIRVIPQALKATYDALCAAYVQNGLAS